MTTSDKIALFSSIISAFGVIVNIVLTLTIINLTKKSAEATKSSADAARDSANAAKESNEITKRMIEKDERHLKGLRHEYKNKIIKLARETHNALLTSFPGDMNGSPGKINEFPTIHGLSEDLLVDLFSDEERDQIRKAWNSFDFFKRTFCRNAYDGHQYGLAVSNAGSPILEFHNLIFMLEQRD